MKYDYNIENAYLTAVNDRETYERLELLYKAHLGEYPKNIHLRENLGWAETKSLPSDKLKEVYRKCIFHMFDVDIDPQPKTFNPEPMVEDMLSQSYWRTCIGQNADRVLTIEQVRTVLSPYGKSLADQDIETLWTALLKNVTPTPTTPADDEWNRLCELSETQTIETQTGENAMLNLNNTPVKSITYVFGTDVSEAEPTQLLALITRAKKEIAGYKDVGVESSYITKQISDLELSLQVLVEELDRR